MFLHNNALNFEMPFFVACQATKSKSNRMRILKWCIISVWFYENCSNCWFVCLNMEKKDLNVLKMRFVASKSKSMALWYTISVMSLLTFGDEKKNLKHAQIQCYCHANCLSCSKTKSNNKLYRNRIKYDRKIQNNREKERKTKHEFDSFSNM